MSDNLLFYKLLKSLNLTDQDEKIIKATVTEFTPSAMKQVLRQMYSSSSDLSITSLSIQQNIQFPSMIKEEVEEVTDLMHRKRKNQFQNGLSDVYQPHTKRSKDLNSLEHSKSPKRYPCHKCYTPDHWDSICSSKFIADNNHQNLHTFIQKANATSFNESVIVDIVKSKSDYTLTFLDTYSSFAVSTCIESVEKGEILDHIENLWINIFNTPYTFICSTNTAISTILKSEEDLTIPILFLDETWVINDLNEYYSKFTDNFFRILKDTNCSRSQAALWTSSIANSTSSSPNKLAPAFCAFDFIPLLPCIKGYKPPTFNCNQQYEVVLNNYFNALKTCNMKRKDVN